MDVSVRQAGDHLDIEVVDSGTGLSDEALARAFEPGWSTKPAGTARRQGRGIGMALVRRTVERLGGEASLSNRADARGAVARARLPLPVAPAVADAPEQEPAR